MPTAWTDFMPLSWLFMPLVRPWLPGSSGLSQSPRLRARDAATAWRKCPHPGAVSALAVN